MTRLKIDTGGMNSFPGPLSENDSARAMEANRILHDGTGAGNDFLGWVGLPSSITESDLASIEEAARDLRATCDLIVVIGIGGSYLGAKAVLEAMSGNFECLRNNDGPKIVFAGQNLSEDYLSELIGVVADYSVGLIVISKSGTTTEPAVAFRILRAELEKKYSREEVSARIIAVTDQSRGALLSLAKKQGYKTFVIPDDVGGRYSVLTPVGLLPLATAGIDIRAIVKGALDMERRTGPDSEFKDNPAAVYAAARNLLYGKGFKIEILASYNPKLVYLAEWWKQLYGESEGKEGLGIFPASVTYTADLHSMGQYIQEGERTLFETVISVQNSDTTLTVNNDPEDGDGLNFLAGRRVSEVEKMAELGVRIAHIDGGVPNLRISIPKLDEYNIGALIYFFEKACGISGYMLGVNPFDQPGVEAYKKNMFALLGKPGYEELAEELKIKM